MKQDDITVMFNKISDYYDRINNFISLGLHIYIKKDLVKLLCIQKNAKVIDLCTGTGDFIKILSKHHPKENIIGLDNSEMMLKYAKIKNPENIFIKADCTNIPFDDLYFDFVVMGFGLRNILDYRKALNEIYRILKTGGIFAHLDFGKHNFLNKIFNFAVPIFVKIVGCDKKPYEYLVKSKNDFLEPSELIKLFEDFNFKLIKRKDYCFGAISLQIMQKY